VSFSEEVKETARIFIGKGEKRKMLTNSRDLHLLLFVQLQTALD